MPALIASHRKYQFPPVPLPAILHKAKWLYVQPDRIAFCCELDPRFPMRNNRLWGEISLLLKGGRFTLFDVLRGGKRGSAVERWALLKNQWKKKKKKKGLLIVPWLWCGPEPPPPSRIFIRRSLFVSVVQSSCILFPFSRCSDARSCVWR